MLINIRISELQSNTSNSIPLAIAIAISFNYPLFQLLPYNIAIFNNSSRPPLMQQRLTEVDHPDHQFIVYPDLGHTFVPSNQWISSYGQIPEYVFQDMFEWLSSPSRQK